MATLWSTIAEINKASPLLYEAYTGGDRNAALEFKQGLIEYVKENHLCCGREEAARMYYEETIANTRVIGKYEKAAIAGALGAVAAMKELGTEERER